MPFNTESLVLGNLYTRPQLAKLWGYNGYQGFSKGVFTPANKKCIVLFVTQQKQNSAIQYLDFINLDFLHWEGEEKHGSDERIANAYRNGEDILLFYRDMHHTPFRYFGPIRNHIFQKRPIEPSKFVFELLHDLSPNDDIAQAENELSSLKATDREILIKARLGQGQFREDLFAIWKGCAITSIEKPELLRASHIKPWRRSENDERLNPYNGLLLLPQYDLLFDRGYITFDERGKIETSPPIKILPSQKLGIDLNAKLRHISTEHHPFLKYHYENIFLKKTNN